MLKKAIAPGIVIIGLQWGDEGKAKIVDVLARNARAVVRFNGGPNAGHTVIVRGRRYILHSVPVGIIRRGNICVIGSGTVFPLQGLGEEILELRKEGLDTEGRIVVSDRAHVILPCYRFWEEAMEERRGKNRINTTRRCIAPAYMAKAGRFGIRAVDLLDSSSFLRKVERVVQEVEQYSGKVVDLEKELADCSEARDKLLSLVNIANTSAIVNSLISWGKKVVFEGAQGTLLDINQGTYPYVTSSNATAGGACTGSGVGPGKIGEVVGVVKAYATRVGEGPFPTELDDETGKLLQEWGGEFGATTGRKRRCGWLDLVALRHAILVNGVTSLALTKVDVLAGITPYVCVAYEVDGRRLDEFPADEEVLRQCKPVLEERPSWSKSKGISRIRRFADLPQGAREFVLKLKNSLGVPIELISVGSRREEVIRLEER